jgi:hypothetical protein
MPKNRIEIPPTLAAKVLFASDRTCCVCRAEKLKVQIHHIDEDPSNNGWENLAVICLHCHSEAHTMGAFVRNLTPELITLYNTSWREIVKVRVLPSLSSAPERIELISEALLQVSLECHGWKIGFMALTPNLADGTDGQHENVWDLMQECWIPPYSPQAYQTYNGLFISKLPALIEKLTRVSMVFADVLPDTIRVELLRGSRQLAVEARAYAAMRQWAIPAEHHSEYFHIRFTEVIRVLRDLSGKADTVRARLGVPASTLESQEPTAGGSVGS